MTTKVSPRLRKNKREEKQWLEYYTKHNKRVQQIKPTITGMNQNDSYDYLHLQLRLKKLQMEEDKFAQVDYENRKLLERVMKIMGSKQNIDRSPRYRHPGSLNSKQLDLEAERIERENKILHERLLKVRASSFSAPTVSSLIKETRTRERFLLDQHLQQQNEALRDRIAETKARLSLSPPYTLRHRPPHESFEDKYKSYAESIQRENKEGRDRIEAIMKSQRSPISSTQPSVKRNPKLVRSFSEDNKALLERIQQATGTINFAKWNKEYESHHRPKDLTKEAKVEKIDNENKELYNRLTKINSTSNKPSLGPLKLDNRQIAHQRRLNAWQKTIDKENKMLYDRIRSVKPVMNTRQKVDSSPEPYEDGFYSENKRLKQRLAEIKKGKKPIPLGEDPVLHPRGHERLQQPKNSNSDDEDQTDEQCQEEEKKKQKKKEKKKDYIVPDGYRKKFRKSRKASKASKEASEDSDSETDSESG